MLRRSITKERFERTKSKERALESDDKRRYKVLHAVRGLYEPTDTEHSLKCGAGLKLSS